MTTPSAKPAGICTPVPPLLDLAKGHPDPTLLPREALAEACASAASSFREGASLGLPYGSRAAGSQNFLEELVSFFARQCPLEAPAKIDGLLLTTGVSHSLELACGVFAQPGEAVLVEAPSYFLAIGIFKSHGLEVVPVPTDDEGVVIEEIERVLDARSPEKPPIRFLYTVPTNNNPKGTTLLSARRRALVELARKRGFLVLADEVYHLLDWHASGERPHRMVCFDEAYTSCQGEVSSDDDCYAGSPPAKKSKKGDGDSCPKPVVISVSSFAKIMAPGLRVGWIEAAPALIKKLSATGYYVSGGCVATFASDAILAHTLHSRSADEALARLVAEYRGRAARLVSSLESHGLPPLVKPCGGYFAWVPLGADATAVLEAAKERYGVTFMVGTRCDASASADSLHCARLCFAYLSGDQIEEAVRRFATAVAEVSKV